MKLSTLTSFSAALLLSTSALANTAVQSNTISCKYIGNHAVKCQKKVGPGTFYSSLPTSQTPPKTDTTFTFYRAWARKDTLTPVFEYRYTDSHQHTFRIWQVGDHHSTKIMLVTGAWDYRTASNEYICVVQGNCPYYYH